MRIINEKHLALVWNWDEQEKNGLIRRYQTNLERLVYAIQQRVAADDSPASQDLRDLADELQEAGEALSESMQNCYEAARTVYVLSGKTPEERDARHKLLTRLHDHLGKPVRLKQTSVSELEGRELILEELRGIKAILRGEGGLWEALADFLVPVDHTDRDAAS
jgi:hypothetical protein